MQSPQDKPQLPKKNKTKKMKKKNRKRKNKFEMKLTPQLEQKCISETEEVL